MKKALIFLVMMGLVLIQKPENCYASTAFGGYVDVVKTASYTTNGTTITISAAKGEDITKTLDNALKEARDMATTAKPVIIKVPAGTYSLTDSLHIYSNTTLDVTGVTLKSDKSVHNMIMSGTNGSYSGQANYNESKACSGYNGFENITIKGGTWVSNSTNTSTIIRIAHAKNVTLDGVTVSGGGCAHQIEVAAIDGFYVKNCTFKDFGKSTTENPEKQEALQLDMPCSSDVFIGVYQDGTVMKNVEVTGCTFSNVPRGVGTHTMLNGAYHENIKINNNTFTNVTEEAIVGLNYYNCEIKNNTIENCGAGILYQYFKAADVKTGDTSSVYTTIFDGKKKYAGEIRHDAKAVISENNITTKYTSTCDEMQGIKVYGINLTKATKGGDGETIPKADYYISGVTVTNNTIKTAGHGMHLVNLQKANVTENTITQSGVSSKDANRQKYDGIFITSGSKEIAITNNTIKNMVRDGIFVQESAYVSTITENNISNCNGDGINFYQKSGASGKISGNKVTDCKDGGIIVSTNSTTGEISGNVFDKIGNAGITVYKKSNSGSIINNVLTDVNDNSQAIKIVDSATCGTISGNKIKKSGTTYAGSNGILVYNKSKVTGSIKKNTIDKTKDTAISISTNSKVTKNIENNKITNVGGSGIFVYKSSAVGGSIIKNTIKTAKDSGIYVTGSVTVKGAIADNEVSSIGGKGVYVYNKSTVKAITNNTIQKAKSQGINLASAKNAIEISGNTISGGSDNVIIIQPATTKYKITIEDNVVKGNRKKNGVRVLNGKVDISNNAISNVLYGVYLDKGVKGTVGVNEFGKYVTTKNYIAGTKVKLKTTNVSSLKSSAKKKATVKWKKISGVEGYEIQYSTKKDFSSGVKSANVKKSKTSATISKLSSGKTYYVRVVGYKTYNGIKVYTEAGKSKSVKVK